MTILKVNKTISNIVVIWNYLNKKLKIRLVFVGISMLATAIAEMVSVAFVIPLLTIISEPDKIFTLSFIKQISNIFDARNGQDLILPLIIIFISAVLFSGMVRLFNLYFTSTTSAIIGEYMTSKALNNILYLPYQRHKNLNSADIITAITYFSNELVEAINEYLRIFTAFFVVLGLLVTLIYIDWKFTLLLTSIFIVIYIFLYIFSKRKLQEIRLAIESISKKQVKLLQESLGSIRNIILDGNQELFLTKYKIYNKKFRFAVADLRFIQLSPRIIIDAIAIVSLSSIGIILNNTRVNSLNTITVLGTIAYMSQRLLPALQQIFAGYSAISSTQLAVDNFLSYFEFNKFKEYKYITKPNFKFNKEIKLVNVSYQYPNSSEYILENISLIVTKGQKIGIIGKTGSGKTTLLDILMGLILPSSGEFIVDDCNLVSSNIEKNLIKWRSILAHVPQDVFLTDDTFYSNIAFGLSKDDIDIQRVIKSASIAMISGFIENLPEKYNTLVGEKGAKLSGGQKQRLGLARAFYKNSEILFLDEATNSLDMDTQEFIMKSIDDLEEKVTIFMVAHRKETLKNCDKIYSVENGKLIELK